VPTQCVQQRAYTAHADEGHHHVDSVGGVHFGEQLASNARFTRGIGEKRGVQERVEWALDPLGTTVREMCQKSAKNGRGLDWGVLGRTEFIDNSTNPSQRVGHTAGTVQVSKRP